MGPTIFWMMLAGALGALARYALTFGIHQLLQRAPHPWLGHEFPLGTLLINVLGSFLLAVVATLVARHMMKPEWRTILGVGFLGAFTTFSTFELDAQQLATRGNWPHFTLYVFGNLALGFAAIFAGQALAMKMGGAAP